MFACVAWGKDSTHFTIETYSENIEYCFRCCTICCSDATIYRPNDTSSRYWPYRIVSISSRKISKFRYIVVVLIWFQYRQNDAYSMLSYSLYIHPTERRLYGRLAYLCLLQYAKRVHNSPSRRYDICYIRFLLTYKISISYRYRDILVISNSKNQYRCITNLLSLSVDEE